MVGGKDLMDELHAVKWDQHVDRFTYKGRPGHFSLTAKTEEQKTLLEENWEEYFREGKLTFKLQEQEKPEEQQLTLTGLPEELKTETIRAYMAKYVIEPKITLVTVTGKGWGPIQTGDSKVTHKGLRKILPRRVLVGPGAFAMVSNTSQIPWDRHTIKCNRCRKEGHHLSWECSKPPLCNKCNRDGHLAAECPYCEICQKWGHKTEQCFFGDSIRKEAPAPSKPATVTSAPETISTAPPASPQVEPETEVVTKEIKAGTQTKAERRSRASRSSSRIRGGKREQKKDNGDQTREGTAEGTPEEVPIMDYQESSAKRARETSDSSDEGGPEKVMKGKEDSNLF